MHAAESVRVLPHGAAHLVVVDRVLQRHDPLGGALEQVQVGDAVDQRPGDLDRRRARPHDADPGTVDGRVVVPAGAVEAGPGEVVQALDVGIPGMVEHAGGGDDHVRHVLRARRGGHVPPAVAPLAGHHLLAEADVAQHAVLGGHPFEVVEDLAAGRERLAPVRVQRERVAVQVGRDVTGDARVRVLPPGTAQPVGLLVDHEVGEAGLAQLDGAEDPGHPGAHHDHPQVPLPGHQRSLSDDVLSAERSISRTHRRPIRSPTPGTPTSTTPGWAT